MRLDPVLESFYLLSSLWSGLPGSQVCPANLSGPSRTTLEDRRGPAPFSAVTAVVDVNVVPMDTERVLANQTVLVEGGQITVMGPATQVSVPAGAVRIDGRGKYLIPGLFDMHVHSHARDVRGKTYDEIVALMVSHVADGVTTLRYLAEGGVSLETLQMFQRAEAKAAGPRVFAPGLSTGSGVRGYKDWTTKLERPDSIAAYVAAARAAGYRTIEVTASAVHARAEQPVVDSLLTAARRLKVPVADHDHERSFGKTLTLGRYGGSTEHLTAFRDTLGLPFANYSDTLAQAQVDVLRAKIPALAAAAGRAGLWLTPTLHCIETKYAPPPAQVMLLRQMVKAMHDAGVGFFLAGDDGWDIHDDLTALVRAGLTPYQALLAGTRHPATYLGVLDSSGTIAVGKRADLVLLYGNPLTDIRNTREPAGVMLHGRWLDRATLDQQLLTSKLSKTAGQRTWLRMGLRNGKMLPPPMRPFGRFSDSTALKDVYKDQRDKLVKHIDTFEAMADSLAKSSGQEGERLRRQMADELGAMRALLPSELNVEFDPRVKFDATARVWLREQARLGYKLMVPGVAPKS